jgi:hypothetical protein
MKNLLPFVFCFLSLCCYAQINTAMPQEANTFYKKAMPTIKAGIRRIIEKDAISLKGRTVNIDSLTKSLTKSPVLKFATKQDIEAIAVLIMVQISNNADEELKELVIHIAKTNTQINPANENDKNSPEKKVERILANKSMIAENVSLVMKRITGAQNVVINNLR